MTLIVQGLRKSYGATPALRGIDLALGEGVVALLGPNGSGKTTLLRSLATSLRPDAGEILWRGRPLWPDPQHVRRHLGYLPQELDFPRRMTPAQLLEHMARLKGCHEPERNRTLLAGLGMAPVADRPLGTLSAGQVRLAGLAQALLGDPSLLLLDEPTRGLDVAEHTALFRRLQGPARRGPVIFSTHIPEDMSPVACRIIVLNRGHVCYTGEVERLLRWAAGRVHELVSDPHGEERLPPGCRISRRSERAGSTVLRIVGTPPVGYAITEVEPTLQDAYLLLLGDDRGDAGSPATPDT